MQDYVRQIISHYENHPSITMIKEHSENTDLTNLKIPLSNINDINQLLMDINIKKSSGPDLLIL